jgi:hypothetical protein
LPLRECSSARRAGNIPAARDAGKNVIAQGEAAEPDRKTFIYVNNRLEGNALETISAMVVDQD